jgi:23S rRNA pseudouridine2605 synthase
LRLNKYIAHAGIASRRAADLLIAEGRVRVDGVVVRELGVDVPEGARVDVSGQRIALAADRTYVVMNKPTSVVTTMRDPAGRRTVAEILPKELPRVVPVGRLDYDTSGLLLLTDDGDLANLLMHPRYGVEKTYRATVRGRLSPDDVRELYEGVRTPEFQAAGAKLRVVASRRDTSVIDLTIHEGRNRQVRKMLEALGHPVLTLERTRFGPLRLGPLDLGSTRRLTDRELAALRAEAAPARKTEGFADSVSEGPQSG